MKKITMCIVMATLCLNSWAYGQNEKIATVPLNINENIPEEFWYLPFNVINHPKGKNLITLNDYRERLVILDFWATWCSACITEMPRMQEIQNQFKDKVIFIGSAYESKEKVINYIPSNKTLKIVNPFSIVGDTVLSNYFPHRLVPHYVWLFNGKVVAITKPEEIVPSAIKAVLENRSLHMKEKRDILNFDVKLPLLENKATQINSLLLYNSVFTKYFSGLFSGQGIQIDTLNKRKRFYYINRPILGLYASAIGYEFGNKVILKVKNHNRFVRDKTSSDTWRMSNSYCYELTVPLETSDKNARGIMFNDLNRYLGLNVRIKDSLINCLALFPINESKNRKYSIGRSVLETPVSLSLNSQIQGRPLRPIIVDESNVRHIPEIEDYMGDLSSLKKQIRHYDLELAPVKRVVKVLIVNELTKNTK